MIRIKLDEQRSEILLFDNLVQVIGIIVHDDVQILLVLVMSEEMVFHFKDIGMFDLFENFKLSVLIFLVL